MSVGTCEAAVSVIAAVKHFSVTIFRRIYIRGLLIYICLMILITCMSAAAIHGSFMWDLRAIPIIPTNHLVHDYPAGNPSATLHRYFICRIVLIDQLEFPFKVLPAVLSRFLLRVKEFVTNNWFQLLLKSYPAIHPFNLTKQIKLFIISYLQALTIPLQTENPSIRTTVVTDKSLSHL